MINIKSIFGKLNIMDQSLLNRYINQEVSQRLIINTSKLHEEAEREEQAYIAQNNKTWDLINDYLTLAMRENKISQDRVDKVYLTFKNMIDKTPDKLLIDIKNPSNYCEIITKEEFKDMVEQLYDKCLNCKLKKYQCTLPKIYTRHGIPPIDGYKKSCKCKYSWKK